MSATPDTTGLREYRRGDVAEVEGRRAVYIPTRWDWMDGTWTTIPLSVGPVLGNLYDLAAHPDPTPEPDAKCSHGHDASCPWTPTPEPDAGDVGEGLTVADETNGWCDAGLLFQGHDGGAQPHPKTDDCKQWRRVPMMPVDPPPPPHIPVGGSEGDQPHDRVRGVPRG